MSEAGLKDITWVTPAGVEATSADWGNPVALSLGYVLCGAAGEFYTPGGQRDIDESFLVMMNAYYGDLDFHFPQLPTPLVWEALVDTAEPTGLRRTAAGCGNRAKPIRCAAHSFALFINRAPEPAPAAECDRGGRAARVQRPQGGAGDGSMIPMRRHHELPFGAEPVADGVRFRLWAPGAKSVTLLLEAAENPHPNPPPLAGEGERFPRTLPRKRGRAGWGRCNGVADAARAGGWWSADDRRGGGAASRYRYRVDGGDGARSGSRYQPDGVHGAERGHRPRRLPLDRYRLARPAVGRDRHLRAACRHVLAERRSSPARSRISTISSSSASPQSS